LADGSFYDPNGYKFNKDGYDEFGGYYDDKYFYYVTGPGYEDAYYANYQEIYGNEVYEVYDQEEE
jgi:hypothetical protein